jgi:uncharacterized membrane protein YoaK (UPF0700 family)
MAHPNEATALAIIAVTAAVSLVLAVLAAGALRRTGNRKLVPVLLAFALFFGKSVLTGYSLRTGFLHHEDLELAGTLLDLLIVLLLMAPFVPLRRLRAPPA